MKEHYVSYECAQALKRFGFEEEVSHYYIHFKSDGEVKLWSTNPPDNHNARLSTNEVYFAPRLDQAAAWIRDCKGIDIEVTTVLRNPTKKSKCYMSNISYFSKDIDGNDCGNYVRTGIDIHSYENALELGISKALELLGKEEKE